MKDIIDEVEHDLKEENSLKLFMKIFPYAIAVGILLVIIVAFLKWYQYKSDIKNQEMGDILLNALEQEGLGNEKVPDESLEFLINKSNTKISDLALIEKAKFLCKKESNKACLDKYKNIIEGKEVSEISIVTKYYAMSEWALRAIEIEPLNTEIQTYIDLLIKPDSPFINLGHLLNLTLLMKLEKYDEAYSYISSLNTQIKKEDLSLSLLRIIPIIQSKIQAKRGNDDKKNIN